MGEVYRAHDARLAREVAIKVLPEALARDSDRLQRFEQEARTLGALNHPNLLAVFDVGATDGLKYLVSELLEGKTLRERLNEGALPQRKVVEYSTKIANGLAAAHEKGVVHRDLKPENVFITKDEQLKILDFGLAKYAADARDAGATVLTGGPGATAPGTVMGTVGYMSPEQVRGEAADSRSDIFSFGAMLYELTTGKRAFSRETAAETMTAILKSEPPDLEGSVPSTGMAQILEHCLEKNPTNRFQSARDLGFALRALSGTGATAALRPTENRLGSIPWKWAAVSTALIIAGAAFGYLSRGKTPTATELRAVLPVPSGVVMWTLGDEAGMPAISPDGSHMVFVGTTEGKAMLFLRPMNGSTTKALAGTDSGKFPFWSPNGKSVAFFADRQLKRVDIDGGPPVVLASADDGRGGTWAGETILYAPYIYGGIWRVPAAGGKAEQVTTPDASLHTTHRWPRFLPDGKHFLYLAQHHSGRNQASSGIYVVSLGAGSPKMVLHSDAMAFYSSGYLLYHRDGSLMAQEFDDGKLELKGNATALGQALRDSSNWNVLASASDNGVLLYQSAGELKYPVVWFDRNGKNQGAAQLAGQMNDIRLAPDGTRVAAVNNEIGPTGDLFVYDFRTSAQTRISFGQNPWFAVWSPDGKQLVYSSQKPGSENTDIILAQSDGSGEQELKLPEKGIDHPTDWTRDGKYIVITHGPRGAQQILLVPTSDDHKPIPLFPGAKVEHSDGRVSPDGKWIAYVTTEFGPNEVFVTAFPSGRGKWQISSGAIQPPPIWGADSKTLYYASSAGDVEEAKLQTSATSIAVEGLRPIFRSPFLTTTVRAVFDVEAKNGPRFIGSVAPDASSLPLNVVTNWKAELKK
jgi:eukaryotic-like serine/threonine-protein kinase